MAIVLPTSGSPSGGERPPPTLRLVAASQPLRAETALAALSLRFELRGLATEALFKIITMDAHGRLRLQTYAPPDRKGADLVRLRLAAWAFSKTLNARGIPCELERGTWGPDTVPGSDSGAF